MRVYRVAHGTRTSTESGTAFPTGPYTAGAGKARRVLVCAHSGDGQVAHHPSPQVCPELGYISPDEVCGADSLDSLLDWFSGHLQLLADEGFRVWVYDVPDDMVRVGVHGQALFPPAFAELVSSDPIPASDVQLPLF